MYRSNIRKISYHIVFICMKFTSLHIKVESVVIGNVKLHRHCACVHSQHNKNVSQP